MMQQSKHKLERMLCVCKRERGGGGKEKGERLDRDTLDFTANSAEQENLFCTAINGKSSPLRQV